MPPIKKLKDIPTYIKIITTAFVLITTIVGGAIAVEKHFVNETENVETLQQMQMTLQQQMYIYRYDFLDSEYDKAKREYQKNPEDPWAKQEFEDIRDKRNDLREDLGL